MVIPSPSFLSGATSCCQYTYFFRGTSSYLLLQISSELQEYLDCAYKMSENKLPKAHFNLKKLPNTQLYWFSFSDSLKFQPHPSTERELNNPKCVFVVWFPPSFSWFYSPVPGLGWGWAEQGVRMGLSCDHWVLGHHTPNLSLNNDVKKKIKLLKLRCLKIVCAAGRLGGSDD